MAARQFAEHEYRVTVRFVQGYRYLDLCGEALIKLERALRPEWIPTEATPRGGSMRNDAIGMTAVFNAEHVTVQQSEALAFDVFRDQACTFLDVLRSTFQVDRFVSPSAVIVYQRQVSSGDTVEADRILRDLALVQVSPKVQSVIGSPSSMTVTLMGIAGSTWKQSPMTVMRRIEGKVVKQVHTPPFDNRMLKRVALLPDRQKEAIMALERLRATHPVKAAIAVELDMETALEGEIDKNELLLYDFLSEVYDWASSSIDSVTSR